MALIKCPECNHDVSTFASVCPNCGYPISRLNTSRHNSNGISNASSKCGGQVWVTGDCHGDWKRLTVDSFPEQKEMTRDDFVIVCGDFGIWHDDKTERWWFDKWFVEKNYTLLFVDGNHENFDRLYGDEFEIVDFHGGKAHKIRENIYHLMRGYVFDLCGKSFFAFGGGSSHDIDDGVLDQKDYATTRDLVDDYNKRTKRGQMLRINHISWWEQEMPSKEEMEFGLQTLQEHNNAVDYVIAHCCPQHIVPLFEKNNSQFKPDALTEYFDIVSEQIQFKNWFFGHYHKNVQADKKYIQLYEQIVRIV